MAPHSSTLAWKIPWTEESGRLQSTGSLRVGHDWATSLSLFTFMRWRRKWQPTPVFLPGESQGWGSLVGCRLRGQSRTQLKRLSSSSNITPSVPPPLQILSNCPSQSFPRLQNASAQGYCQPAPVTWAAALFSFCPLVYPSEMFWAVMLEKTPGSPMNSKEIKPVNSKGNQPWTFIGRTDAEAPILWPPDAKSQFIGKDADARKDWRQEKGTTDQMVGWHHQLNGQKSE